MAVRLHIVGAGRVGRVLARRWFETGTVEPGWILNRSLDSAERAVAFIGAGRAVARADTMRGEDWLMLAVPDGEIAAVAARLAALATVRPAIAFHLSGAEDSALLRGLATEVASVHPVCPFADAALALSAIEGRFAVAEGDAAALDRLLPAFEAIGMRTQRFTPTSKRLYHAAMIAASNYLVSLDALALDLAEASGLDADRALPLICDLQRTALDNIERLGPLAALTGPFERGDRATTDRLRAAAGALPAESRALFEALARATEALAGRKRAGVVPPGGGDVAIRAPEASHGGV